MAFNPITILFEKLYLFYHRNKKLSSFNLYKKAVTNKKGLEIGGPSRVFKKKLPIYHFTKSLDGINFSSSTLWEKNLCDEGRYKYFMQRVGVQYIREATELIGINDSSYDFVSSSHCLEHVANPLKALKEWARVIKENGHLILVLPKKSGNFDRNRPATNFNHILEDFIADTSEDDLTHLKEIINLHDFSMDKESGSITNFIERGKKNFVVRGLHHHVFDKKLIKKSLDWSGFSIIDIDHDKANYFILAGKN